MTSIGTGNTIYQLRKKINKIKEELNSLESTPSQIPELIDFTNLLRKNNSLSEINSKKTELLYAYQQYSDELQNLLESVFTIQNELKEILKSQSSLISESKTTKKKRIKKTTKK